MADYSAQIDKTVRFNDTSTNTDTQSIYTWNFGDGSASQTGKTVDHVYSTKGTYSVVHTVKNSCAANAQTKTKNIEITETGTTPTTSTTSEFGFASIAGIGIGLLFLRKIMSKK